MKAILEFDLNDRDELEAHQRCIKALDLALALYEIGQELRRITKYGEDEEKVKHTEEFKKSFYRILDEHGVVLDDLLS